MISICHVTPHQHRPPPAAKAAGRDGTRLQDEAAGLPHCSPKNGSRQGTGGDCWAGGERWLETSRRRRAGVNYTVYKWGWRREMQCSARWWPTTGRWRGGEAGVAGEIDRGHLTGTQPGDSENKRQLPTANRSLRQAQALDMPLNACRAKAAASWEQDATCLLIVHGRTCLAFFLLVVDTCKKRSAGGRGCGESARQ
jgi:hypothetical protein